MPLKCSSLRQSLSTLRSIEAELKTLLLSAEDGGDYDRVRELRAWIEESVKSLQTEMHTKEFIQKHIAGIQRDLGVDIGYEVNDNLFVSFTNAKEDLSQIIRILRHKRNRLINLSLLGNKLGPTSTTELIKALTDPNCKLMSLNLGKKDLNPAGMTELIKALTDPNCKLTSLNLWNNNLGPAGMTELTKALTDPNCKLTSLDLEFNNLGPAGMTELTKALTDPNCKLTSLNLAANNLGSTSATEELIKALTDPNCKLTSLDFGYNHLTEADNAKINVIVDKIRAEGREIKVIL
jgi:uncharacterized protein YjgD (DUF1641 family)